MSLGLKKYTHQLEQELVDAKFSVNTCDLNLIGVINVLSTSGIAPINLNLIFNLENKDEDGLFGKGFKLDLYKKIESKGRDFKITNADGSVDNYYEANGYYNKETKLTASEESTDEDIPTYTFSLDDSSGKDIAFSSNEAEYPNYPYHIRVNSKVYYGVDFMSTPKVITNNKDKKVKFILDANGKVETIKYYLVKNGLEKLKKSTEFTYLNGMINTITNYICNDSENKLCQSVYKISLSNTQMIISEDYSKEKLVYELSNKKVTSFSKYYDEVLDKTSQVKLNNLGSYTIITDYKNRMSFVAYKDNLPVMMMDRDGNTQEIVYDLDSKEVIYKSDVIPFCQETRNLLKSKSILNMEEHDEIFSKDAQIEYTCFKKILGNSLIWVSGVGYFTKTIAIPEGLGGDSYEFAMFCATSTAIRVSLKTDSEESVSREFSFKNDGCQIITLDLKTLKSYKNITLTITLLNFDGYIGGLCLFKKSIGTTAVYDNKGNIIGQSNGVFKSSFKYNANNQLSDVRSSQGVAYNIEYENGNVVSSIGAYDIKTENEYDDNNNLVKTKLSTHNEEKVIQYGYDSNGYLASKTDELGHTERYENDSLGKILKSTDALSRASLYKYDNYMNLNNLMLNNNHSTDYSYDSRHRLIEISNRNGIKYNFTYDNFNNVTKVELNGTTLFKFTYNDEMQLISQQYGDNGDIYNFKYDSNDNIIEIKYGSSTRYKFNYNSLNQITSIVDQNGQVLNNYEYDINGNITREYKTNMDLSYDYDDEGNIIKSKREINNKKIYQSFDSLSKSQGAYPESIVNELANSWFYAGTYITNSNLIGHDKKIYSLDNEHNQLSMEVKRDNFIPCLEFSDSNALVYNIPDANYGSPKGTIAMWFKPDNLDGTKYLFSQKYSKGNGFVGVYIKDKKLHLEIHNAKNQNIKVITSDYEVNQNAWNYFSLSFFLPSIDEFMDNNMGEFDLCLNGHIQIANSLNDTYFFNMDFKPDFHIGHCYFNGVSAQYTGKIALLAISNGMININTLMNYYKLTKDYIYDNQDYKIANVSITKLYTIDSNIQNNFEIFPLQNDLKSLKGTLPTKYDIRTYATADNDRIFNYNYLSNDYSYIADGQPLEYNLSPKDSGTIMLRAFTDAKTDKQYFFEGFNDKQTLGLYRNANNKLCLDLDGKVVESSLTVSTGSWHTIGISYDTEDPNDSQVVFKYKNIRFFVDGLIDTKQVQTWFNYSSLSFMIGRSHAERTIINYADSYPLYGQIKMLAVSNYNVSEATLRNLASEIKDTFKVNGYDQFGRLKRIHLHNAGNTILANTYSYKCQSDDTHSSNQISKERISFGTVDNYRSYETDALGNVINITNSSYNILIPINSLFENHNYTYDYRGFLTKEDDIEYAYDNNGNITKAGNDTFTYDNLNRLRSVNGWPISYSSTNPGNPRKNNDIEYEFEGRRLKSVSEPMGIDEQKTVDYTYDSNGLIIKKVLGYWYDDDRDSEEFTTQYYYDGDKLVTEINQYCRFDFLYDENGLLYGLIKDNSSKYFYVRDYLQNILGIVDQNGKLVVKYKYDAYGNNKGIEDTSGCNLGTRNPFRYKGYYYDDDTDMYYCKSRFYVPEWRRWLNSDSINYLEPESITCLNLFAYCNNNPVMYVDPTGHSILLAILIGAGIGSIVGALSYTASECVSAAIHKEWSWSWEMFAGSMIGGGVSGALSIIPGIGASLTGFINGTVTSFVGMSLQNLTGSADYTINQIVSTSLITGCISGMASGLMDKIKISKISKGRGSFKAVSNQINTRLINGNINSIVSKTFGKMLVYNFTNSLLGMFLGGCYDELIFEF